eukprot:GHVL01018421.1.p1 GENE.GHVL01018421.1~~GHVL01018421.1.p1  ORF type:complete len:1638 (-),score=198.16 GHVL01018421.1:51-4964(-)
MYPFFALVKKNFLLKRRQPIATCIQFIAPILMCYGLMMLLSQVPLVTVEGTTKEPVRLDIPHGLDSTIDFAVVGTHSSTKDFLEFLGSYLESWMENKRTNEFYEEAKRKVHWFKTEKDLEQHITAYGYKGTIRSAIVFTADHPHWKFTIRNKMIQMRNMESDPVNPKIKGFDYENPNKLYIQNHFTTAQTLIYSYIYYKRKLHTPRFNTRDYWSFVPLTVTYSPFPHHEYKENVLAESFSLMLAIIWSLIFLPNVSQIIKSFVEEKENRVREMMCMMGLSKMTLWLSWYFTYGIIFFLQSVILTSVLKFVYFKETQAVLIFLLLFLFLLSILSFGLLFSAFMTKTRVANLVTMVFFTALNAVTWSVRTEKSKPINLLACLSPITAFNLGYTHISNMHSYEKGLHFSDVFDTKYGTDYGSVLIMMIFDIVLFFLLGVYFDSVIPGDVGSAKPFYFLFTPSFWKSVMSRTSAVPEIHDSMDHFDETRPESDCFEAVRSDARVTVKVRNLRKVFSLGLLGREKMVAVEGSSMNIHEHEILALLGHNGAGKTTTIGMLTGLTPVSSGDAWIYDRSVKREMHVIRKSLGVCPQHDVLYGTLSVLEHLSIYSDIKGVPRSQKRTVIAAMVNALHLREKINAKSSTLSGGQKRRLSVAMALIGGSKMVFLDEPSTGMDPFHRRILWDVLKTEKINRTIILTTHFMEEADYLGDRIAIMAHGKLMCLGTSMFLKLRFGVGYTLTCCRNHHSTRHELSLLKSLIKMHVPNYETVDESDGEVTFRLPTDMSPKFHLIFERIEKEGRKYGVDSFAVSITTLEEVFMNVGKSGDEDVQQHVEEGIEDDSESDSERDLETSLVRDTAIATRNSPIVAGFGDLFALTIKRVHTSKRELKGFILQVVIPILILGCGCYYFGREIKLDYTPLELSPSKLYPQPNNVLVSGGAMKLASNYKKGESVPYQIDDIINYDTFVAYILKKTGGVNLFGAIAMLSEDFDIKNTHHMPDFNDPYRPCINIFFNFTAIDAVPAFYNDVATLFLRERDDKNANIIIKNHPLPATKEEESGKQLMFLLVITLAFSFIPSFWGMWVVKERVSNAKHLQLIAGVSIVTYWLATWIWNFLFYLIPAWTGIGLFFIFKIEELIESQSFMYTLLVIHLYGFTLGPITYLLSFLFKDPFTAQLVLLFFYIITGPLLSIIAFICQILENSALKIDIHYKDVIVHIFRISPSFNFCIAILGLITKKMPLVWGSKKNAKDAEITGTSSWVLLAQGTVCFLLTVAIDYAISTPAISKMLSFGNHDTISAPQEEDIDVARERQEIEKMPNNDPDGPLILVRGLRKVFGREKIALDNLHFKVDRGECFGFLGVNGAGKTTTLKILTGLMVPTRGTAELQGLDVLTEQNQIRRFLGYCPQFDALIDNLSGTEHLYLFARIRGIKSSEIKDYVDKMINSLGLKRYGRRNATNYSGGNKRKLSLGISLIGGPRIIFLDEPSSGVDPASKRFLWQLISRTMRNRSCILTTHSMEECEALCSKIGIMVAGRLRCLGNAQHLKHRFGQGYQLWIKSNTDEYIEELKVFVQSSFTGAEILECYGMIITYSLPVSNSITSIFRKMEYPGVKAHFQISDYTVSQASLEQIFVRFAGSERTTESG